MYGLLWRHLPGPWFARLGELLVLLVGILALLFYVVFPAVDPHLPFNEVTVQQPASTPTPTVTTDVTTTVTTTASTPPTDFVPGG
jgi:hypothetical protein